MLRGLTMNLQSTAELCLTEPCSCMLAVLDTSPEPAASTCTNTTCCQSWQTLVFPQSVLRATAELSRQVTSGCPLLSRL